MIVEELNFGQVVSYPAEAKALLLIDVNTVLALSVAFQFFRVIARRRLQKLERAFDIANSFGTSQFKQRLSVSASTRLNQ